MNFNHGFEQPLWGTIYFSAPFEDKETVKSFGAKWNPKIKKWSYYGPHTDYINFAKWLMGDESEIVIATGSIYILEAKKKCYRCGDETRVIALGIADYVKLSQEIKGLYNIDLVYEDENISLATGLNPETIPPKLLEYLESNYCLKLGRSSQRGKYYANHCEHCGAIQGDNYLLYESGATFSTDFFGEKLKERMSKIKVFNILIDDDIALNWGLIRSTNGNAYTQYGEVKDLALPGSDEEGFISYKDLYNL